MLPVSFVALQFLGANITSKVTTAVDFVLVVVHKGLEGELTIGKQGLPLVEHLLATRGRHCGRTGNGGCDG
jgi:hypothetical protein